MENIAEPERKCKSQSTARRAGPRSGRPRTTDERDFVLPLLRAAGRAGINRNHFLRGTGPLNGRQITQIGRLVHQLEKEGYQFIHERRDDSPFIYYALVAEPLEPKNPAPGPLVRKPQVSASMSASMKVAAAVAPEQIGMFGTFVAYETGRMDRGRR